MTRRNAAFRCIQDCCIEPEGSSRAFFWICNFPLILSVQFVIKRIICSLLLRASDNCRENSLGLPIVQEIPMIRSAPEVANLKCCIIFGYI